MRVAASTGFFRQRLDGSFITYIESIRRCKKAGFDAINISFSPAIRGNKELAEDNWEELMHDLRDEAEKIGMDFTISHPVFTLLEALRRDSDFFDYYKEMMRRSIKASAILGVKWAILHPFNETQEAEFDLEANLKINREMYDWVVDLAKKHNVGIAFENMLPGNRRFASQVDELIALIDSYDDPLVGACWDFGHANNLYKDQTHALRKLGKRLKATHVADNYGKGDDHMFPFHGSTDWHSIMPVLKEIEYEGDFTLETGKEFTNVPDHLRDNIARVGYEIGQYCLSLAVE